MDLMTAIKTRISCRAYTDRLLGEDQVRTLQAYIEDLNATSGLSFQLYGPRGEGQTALDMNSQMFSGPVYYYAALIAAEDPLSAEKVGYFGEKLALRATQLGLGTCWVASTYDKSSTLARPGLDECVWDVMPLGYAPDTIPLKQRTIRATVRRTNKKPSHLVNAPQPYEALPEWFRAGIDAVLLGPSAVNGQPVVFEWREGDVRATLPKFKRDIEYNDLGIAKLHFEIAAAAHGKPGHWEWGVGGRYLYEG